MSTLADVPLGPASRSMKSTENGLAGRLVELDLSPAARLAPGESLSRQHQSWYRSNSRLVLDWEVPRSGPRTTPSWWATSGTHAAVEQLAPAYWRRVGLQSRRPWWGHAHPPSRVGTLIRPAPWRSS